MLYASTKASLKKEFGGGQLKEEFYANMLEEVTLAGYRRHLRSEAAPGPLTREEEEMMEIKQTESRVEISVDTKQATLASLQFPFEKQALNAIESYWRKGYDYLQLGIGKEYKYEKGLEIKRSKGIYIYHMTYFCITLCISDLEEEIIVLKVQGGCNISELPSKVPTDGARYHLFRFKHTYEGDSFESNGEWLFVFSGTKITDFHCSFYLFHARIFCLNKGENVVFQL